MGIMTRKMGARQPINPWPHIANNALVGKCSPLKHFFCAQGVVTNPVDFSSVWTSAVGNLSAYIAAGLDLVTVPGRISGGVAATDPVSGTIDLDGTGDLLIVIAAMPSSGSGILRAAFGDTATGTGARVQANTAGTAGLICRNGSTTDTLANLTCVYGNATVLAGCFDRGAGGAGGTAVRFDAATAAKTQVGPTALTNTGLSNLAFTEQLIFTGENIAAIAAFRFAGQIPSNWQAQAANMGFQWLAGNYVVPASWDGR